MKKLGVLALSDPTKGGTFQYTLSMLEGLRHLHGWDITIYTKKDNLDYEGAGFAVRHIEGQLDRRFPLLAMTLTVGLHRDPFVDEDVVLAPIYSPLLLHTKKPFIYTLHDLQELYYPQFFSLAQRIWRRYIHAKLTKKAARIVCESRFVKADVIRAFKVSAHKIDVIVAPPLPMQDIETALNGSEIRKKYGLHGHYLFYPAQFWEHKNHLRLVEAFVRVVDSHPDCQLVLTGKKRDEYERVFKRIEELGLGNKVKHIGYVDQEELPGLYREATALIMPSLFESVSIPVFEAFQLGTPVAASNIVALPEQIGDAGLLFDPLSVDSIEAAIRKLLDDPDLCQQLSNRGYLRLATLTFEKNSVELEAALGQLVNPVRGDGCG